MDEKIMESKSPLSNTFGNPRMGSAIKGRTHQLKSPGRMTRSQPSSLSEGGCKPDRGDEIVSGDEREVNVKVGVYGIVVQYWVCYLGLCVVVAI